MVLTGFIARFFKKERQEDVNYLSLTLTPDEVLASIWIFDEEQVEVLGFAKKAYQNIDNIIHPAAIAIDTAAEKAGSDVKEVVFGLSANWFQEGQLLQETSKLLKKLSEDLELSAQAFVPLSSSIKNFLKIEESVTSQAVLVGAFNEDFEVHLIKNDEVKGTKIAASKPTAEKISSIVKQLKGDEALPARVIVFGAKEDSKLASDIIKTDWQDLFISQPKIEFLEDSKVSKSVVYSQAADILGHEPLLTGAVEKVATQEEKPQANELGFIEGEDILKAEAKDGIVSAEAQRRDLSETQTDVRRQPQIQREDLAVEIDQDVKRPEDAIRQEEPAPKESFVESIATLTWFTKFTDIFKKRASAKKLLFGVGALLVIVGVSFLIGGRTFTKAEVVIKVNAKSEEDSFDVDVLKGGLQNFAKQQIGGNVIVGKASGSRKAVATGKKEIGESAKGEVTVFNWTSTSKKFPEGSTIITKNGLKFSLDDAIEATSASAPSGPNPGLPGKAQVKVTAENIGSDYNLGAGQEFTFVQFDEFSYSAQNDVSFSGGDEKEVTVVSQEDLDNLEESLAQSLRENAVADLKNNAAGQKFHEETTQVEVVKQSFDKKLDEEASLVNLDLEIEVMAISYSEDNLKELLAENTKGKTPENLEAKRENIEILTLSAKSAGSTLNLLGKFKANFIPKFDESKLKEQIAGKSVKEVREIVKGLPEVSDVTVNFSPTFFFASLLPADKEKISFKVES